MHDADPASIKIMFYFKDAPLAPSDIDPEQLALVKAFQKSLGQEGALYWKFKDIKEFEKLLRLHITRQVQAFKHAEESEITLPKQEDLPGEIKVDSDRGEAEDLGLIDLVEIYEERFTELGKIMGRLTKSTGELGKDSRKGPKKSKKPLCVATLTVIWQKN